MLDVLTQRLHGTADFLGALAPGLPVDWVCDVDAAIRLLTLSDLARRLGHLTSDVGSAGDDKAGELEFFGTEDCS